jgi:hypothetical protein
VPWCPPTTSPTQPRPASDLPRAVDWHGPSPTQVASFIPGVQRSKLELRSARRYSTRPQVPFRAQQQEQARKARRRWPQSTQNRARHRCCGCGRSDEVGPRTSRQNDGRRHPGRSAERHVGCARGRQAHRPSGGLGHAANRQRGLNRALIRSTTSVVAPVSVRVDARARSDSNEPADVPGDCPDIDPSARLGHSPDTDRSDGVTS